MKPLHLELLILGPIYLAIALFLGHLIVHLVGWLNVACFTGLCCVCPTLFWVITMVSERRWQWPWTALAKVEIDSMYG